MTAIPTSPKNDRLSSFSKSDRLSSSSKIDRPLRSYPKQWQF
ncbi:MULTISPECIES: hypothetical protein [unclassified Microcystis]|nr:MULTISPECIES: hypothetical protein [unclassified Microcystis]